MRKFIDRTVFHRIGDDWGPDKVLAVLYHRSAATLYLIYFLWGIASIFGSIPTLVEAQGDFFQIAFSTLVLPTAFCALLGATFFPKFARLEMYSAASLVTLVLVYEVFIALAFFQGDVARGVSFVLNSSFLVIPISRVIFIYLTLIKQAGEVSK